MVIVTGASSGIGRATAVAFGAKGHHVVLIARGPEMLAEAAAATVEAGAASAEARPADVLDVEAIDRIFDDVMATHGRVDVVVHSAMVMAYGTVEDLGLDVLDRVMDTATHGTVRVSRAALRHFRSQRRGSLIIVTSLLGSVAVPGIGAYVTGKWAQVGLARILRLETADAPDIHVTTVAPGAVDTPIYRRAASVEGHPGKPPPPVDAPEKVAAAIVRASEQGSRRVSVGTLNPLVVFGFRFVTPLYDRLVGPLYRRFALEKRRVQPNDGNVFRPSDPDQH
ncbi:SDR family oxidoreductase [soil metagenome]